MGVKRWHWWEGNLCPQLSVYEQPTKSCRRVASGSSLARGQQNPSAWGPYLEWEGSAVWKLPSYSFQGLPFFPYAQQQQGQAGRLWAYYWSVHQQLCFFQQPRYIPDTVALKRQKYPQHPGHSLPLPDDSQQLPRIYISGMTLKSAPFCNLELCPIKYQTRNPKPSILNVRGSATRPESSFKRENVIIPLSHLKSFLLSTAF